MSLARFQEQFRTRWHETLFQSVDDQLYTYGDTWCHARQIAHNWHHRGLKPGDVIAFRAANGYHLPCLYLACLMGGYVACPVVPSLDTRTVEENLSLVQAALYLEGESPELPNAAADAEPPLASLASLDDKRPFLIMFSSGSTGRNKAICHSFDNVAGSAGAFADLSSFDETTALYHVLPMTYMAGFLNAMLAVIMAGGRIVEGPQFSMETVADFWRRPFETDANTLSVIPPLAAAVCRLTRDPEKIARVREQFRLVQCTSQSIQQDLRQRFLAKFGLPLRDCYGMTELGGPLSIQDLDDATSLNDYSHPLHQLEIDIREQGELWIRSPFAMLGYLEDGELTNPFDDDGFLDTGDLADIDAGRIMITGRVKDIIIKGGVNTSPARIESIMSQMPGISEVAVVGMPHNFWGEEIVACVVAESTDQNKILTWCREHLSAHEVPDRIEFLDEFPRSFIGKVLKRHLVMQLAEDS